MSGLGTHTGASPTGLGAYLQATHDAGSPVPALFALDINIKPDIVAKSPTTKLVFRTQQFGPDNGAMYAGDAVAAGRARVDQCYPILKLNPADWYALDNEPGRADAAGLQWLCNYYLGEMQRADELGIKLCVGEWSTGMPPISAAESMAIAEHLDSLNNSKYRALRDEHYGVAFDADVATTDYISIYAPMFRYAVQHGHIVGLHEYSLDGPMIGSPLCLRYRTLYNALPIDARPKFFISEAGPGAGYATGYTMQAYIDVVAAYDAELVKDVARGIVLGCALFKLGKGESDMTPVMPLLTEYVKTHKTPAAPPQPQAEREFDHWLDVDSNTVIGTTNPLPYTVTGPRHIRAMTRPKPPAPTPLHEIVVDTDGYGTVTGGGMFALGAATLLEWRP